jgi:hypothetical protein
MRVYPAPADGLADAMRLSAAMTWKMAGAGMPRGGGKAVLAVPELPAGEPRRRLLRRYGELVASLGGSYRTAGDMNIAPEDLDVVAETCPWVYGTTSGGGNSGRGTARGCLYAIRATVEHLFGSPELAGRSVLVQGAGRWRRPRGGAGRRGRAFWSATWPSRSRRRRRLRTVARRARGGDRGGCLLAVRKSASASSNADSIPRWHAGRSQAAPNQPARRAGRRPTNVRAGIL